MKTTDYAPRAAAMDVFLMGGKDMQGFEIGCDVGAHAEAMLTYLDISSLVLVDAWQKEWCKGYCEGRLTRWKGRVWFLQSDSHKASGGYSKEVADFIYIDIAHDYNTVKQSLHDWWPKLKLGGILGYRNYSTCQQAIDEFIQANNIRFEVDKYHNEIIMFK